MKKKQSILITGLIIPFIILSVFGGIVSGIWLAILGEWGVIMRGIITIVISSFAISIALMPTLLLYKPTAKALEKGKNKLGLFLGSLSLLYIIALVTVWCVWIMWSFTSLNNHNAIIPIAIWSYGVALAPWMYLSSKESSGSQAVTTSAQIAYIVGIIMLLLGTDIKTISIVFGVIMLLSGAISLYWAHRETEFQKMMKKFDEFDKNNPKP